MHSRVKNLATLHRTVRSCDLSLCWHHYVQLQGDINTTKQGTTSEAPKHFKQIRLKRFGLWIDIHSLEGIINVLSGHVNAGRPRRRIVHHSTKCLVRHSSTRIRIRMWVCRFGIQKCTGENMHTYSHQVPDRGVQKVRTIRLFYFFFTHDIWPLYSKLGGCATSPAVSFLKWYLISWSGGSFGQNPFHAKALLFCKSLSISLVAMSLRSLIMCADTILFSKIQGPA